MQQDCSLWVYHKGKGLGFMVYGPFHGSLHVYISNTKGRKNPVTQTPPNPTTYIYRCIYTNRDISLIRTESSVPRASGLEMSHCPTLQVFHCHTSLEPVSAGSPTSERHSLNAQCSVETDVSRSSARRWLLRAGTSLIRILLAVLFINFITLVWLQCFLFDVQQSTRGFQGSTSIYTALVEAIVLPAAYISPLIS